MRFHCFGRQRRPVELVPVCRAPHFSCCMQARAWADSVDACWMRSMLDVIHCALPDAPCPLLKQCNCKKSGRYLTLNLVQPAPAPKHAGALAPGSGMTRRRGARGALVTSFACCGRCRTRRSCACGTSGMCCAACSARRPTPCVTRPGRRCRPALLVGLHISLAVQFE